MAAQPPNAEEKPTLIIAVDYGTTFSGVCWVLSDNLEMPHVVRTWPLADGTETTSDKVPTRITYDAQDKVKGWGYMIQGSEPRYQEFKLYLDHSKKTHHAGMGQKFKDPASLPLTQHFTATKLSVDFLRELRNWLEVDVDKNMGAGTFESMPLQYIITVPAIWSDPAKSLTRWCAEKAGMGNNLKIITEPEAAMVHVLQKLPEGEYKVGDCFILCDAGGGTADLITYKIKSLAPLEVEEVVQGDGDRCGSVYLDRQFKAFIEYNHAKRVPEWTEQHTTDAVDYFERITKRKFDGSDEPVIVKVHGAPSYTKNGITIKKGKLLIQAAYVRMMFAIVVDVIRKLVNEQYRRAVRKERGAIAGVVLVGGFGASDFVKQELETAISWNDKHIKLYRPDDGWTAIVRGAISRALPIWAPQLATAMVISRQARLTYGITCSRPFRPGRDPEDKKHWVEIEQKFYIEEIHWFLTKGTTVKKDYVNERSYVHDWPQTSVNAADSTISLKVYAWDGDDAVPPKYPSSEGVEKIADLNVDLSVVPKQLLRGFARDGVVRLWCDPWLRITYSFATVQYTLFYHGKDYGSVEAGFGD